MKAILTGTMSIPREFVSRATLKELTLSVYHVATDETSTHRTYTIRKGQVHMPRQYGLHYATRHDLDIEDRTAGGFELPKLQSIALRPEQVPWTEDLVDHALHGWDLRAKAGPGKGKTVMALEAARRIGRTTLILVDQENIMAQWVDRIQEHLGIDREDIGTIQGDTWDYEHPFVVAMVQTLFRRKAAKEVYNYFGTCIADECHTIGAPRFSEVLAMIPAEIRFGISATPVRKDELEKVLKWSLGTVDVEMRQTHKKSKVRVLTSSNVYSWYANNARTTGRYINEIAADGERNLLLVSALHRLYDKGRTVLVLSERIEHLHQLFAMSVQVGMPESNMGIYCRYHETWKYAKDKTPPRQPYGWVKGTLYTPVALQLVRQKTTQDILDDIAATRQIIFATYAMFSKAVDVPRLDAGMDCTPRATFEQIHGRILRIAQGKKIPMWITTRDINSPRAERQLAQRLGEFSNVEVELWDLERGLKAVGLDALKRAAMTNYKRLKDARIITALDGHNMLMTGNTAANRERGRASTIAQRRAAQ